MKRPNELDRLLGGLEPAPPPQGARARILASARAAVPRQPVTVDLWSRVWTSRKLRLAWVTAVAVLLGANLMLSVDRPGHAGTPTHPVAAARPAAPDPELAAVAELPPLRLDVLPNLGEGRGRHASTSHGKPS